MGFRSRLYLLVVVTGLLPILAAALVAYGRSDPAGDLASGRLSQAQTVVLGAYERSATESNALATRLRADPRLPTYLREPDAARARARLRAIAREYDAVIVDLDRPASAAAPIASAVLRVEVDGTQRRLRVAAERVDTFVRLASQTSGAVVGIDTPTGRVGDTPPPESRSARLRVREGQLTIALDVEAAPSLVERVEQQPLLWGALVGLLLIGAALLSLTVSLTGAQLRRMREAAAEIREGRYDTRVEVVGKDDLAGLGEEFNAMGTALQERDERLRVEHERLQRSWDGVGELLSGTLDEDALLPAVAGLLREVSDAQWLSIVVEAPDGRRQHTVGATTQTATSAIEEAMTTSDHEGDGARILVVEHGHVVALAGEARIVLGLCGAVDVGERLVTILRQLRVSLDNARLHAQVERDASLDGLTGLANRRSARTAISVEIDRSERYGHPLSLLLFDLDNFKGVNDVYGHAQGDEVLRVVADTLRSVSRTVDVAGRWGGEEFVVVLPEADTASACIVAERICEDLRETVLVTEHGEEIVITASIGVTTREDEDVDALVDRADVALYAAKAAGKDRVVVG